MIEDWAKTFHKGKHVRGGKKNSRH
jgi:hypothetical protein